jgi:hypothetical protein
MNYSLQGSPFNLNESDDIEIKRQQRNVKNKTLKKPANSDRSINNGRLNMNNGLPVNSHTEKQISNNAKNMIGSIHSQGGFDNDDSPLADFYPPPHGELQGLKGQQTITEQDVINQLKPIENYHVTSINKGEEVDGPVHIEGFNSLPANNSGANGYGPPGYNVPNTHGLTYTGPNNYVGPYKNQIPYYTDMSKNLGNKDQLLEKLNYMIHLLEEQQDEKTGHVMEELILYSFLGVFLIFIVDSFARSGKYTR